MKQSLFISLLLLLFSCSNANTEIVAEVNGDNILLSDLSEASKQELFDLLNMAYEIKSKVLDDLIKKKLLENEAKKQNITTEQYLDLYMDMIGTKMDSIKRLYGLSDNQINVMRGQLYSSSKETMEGELVLKNKLRSDIIQQLTD